jgi:hypothetical protein
LTLLTLLAFGSCNGGGPDLTRKRVVFLFCDVTNSLSVSESGMVATLAADILDRLPPRTEYRVYPILAGTGQLAPINDAEKVIPRKDENNPNLYDLNRETRRQELAEKLNNLYHVTNVNRYDNRTCILNAVNFAHEQFRDFNPESYDRDLVIISDMLEECDVTILQKPVDIRKGDISNEVKLAQQGEGFPDGLDLSNIVINVVTPATDETYRAYQPGTRPPMPTLQEFWFSIFKRAKVAPANIQNPDKCYWSNGVLPNRYTRK